MLGRSFNLLKVFSVRCQALEEKGGQVMQPRDYHSGTQGPMISEFIERKQSTFMRICHHMCVGDSRKSTKMRMEPVVIAFVSAVHSETETECSFSLYYLVLYMYFS